LKIKTYLIQGTNFRIIFVTMNFLDLILIIPLVIGGWRGFKRGLVIEVFTRLALLVGIYAGIHFSDYLSDILKEKMGFQSEYLPAISFTIILLMVGAMVYFAGKIIEKAVNIIALSMANKIAGMFFGLIKMLYIVSILLVLFEAYEDSENSKNSNVRQESLLYSPIKHVSLTTIPALKHSKLFVRILKDSNALDHYQN